jgi:lipopolysaccharide export system protein LptC
MTRPTNRLRMTLIVLLLLIAALGSLWVLQVMQRESEDTPSKLQKGESDYSVNQFNILRMSKTGKARYSISGVRMTHFPDGDTFEIQKPVIYSVNENQVPLTMRAERAVVDHLSNKVHMYTNVRLDRPASAKDDRFHLNSEYLLFLPDEDVMQTDNPVQIDYGTSHLSGVGMFANNATREFRLLRQVRGTFEAPVRR